MQPLNLAMASLQAQLIAEKHRADNLQRRLDEITELLAAVRAYVEAMSV